MLKKKYRLPSSIRLEKPKTISAKYFILKIAASPLLYPRFAFVISKKVDARAVVRNRIKREMTSYVSAVTEKLAGKDIIFILKKGAAENIKELAAEIEKNISKLS